MTHSWHLTPLSTNNNRHMTRTALFPGTFDPFTTGHASIVERALGLFDRVIIAIGYNPNKCSAESIDGRMDTIRRLYADDPRVEVAAYNGLTVDACRTHGAGWMVRGVRSVADFEYERNLADINRSISGIDTVVLFTTPELSFVSSSMVRELASHGHDITAYIPD